jgi:hypothetical protein
MAQRDPARTACEKRLWMETAKHTSMMPKNIAIIGRKQTADSKI